MCVPLALAAAAVSTVGTMVGGVMQQQQMKYQAKVAEQNAAMSREKFALEQEGTRREALNHYRRVAQLKGQQIAHAAGSNVSTNFGTAQDTVTDTNMLAREDLSNLFGQSLQRMKGIDREVANFEDEATAARRAGKAAIVGAAFSSASTMLGGASQYSQLKAGMGVPKTPTSAPAFPNPGPSNWWGN